MIRFFHTADIHFGMENYGRIDPKTGIHTRLLDFKKALMFCVEHAIEEKIDFFLFCGDAYKTAYPTPTQQKLFTEVFFSLYRAGIPVVIVVGNHDHPLSFGKAHALDLFSQLPVDGFHVISKPSTICLSTKSGIVNIVGIPWPTRHNLLADNEHRFKKAEEITTYLSQRVGQAITHLAGKLDPNIPAVLAGHLTVSSGVFSGSEKCAVFGSDPVFLPSQLAIPPFNYVALGHLHRHQDLNKSGTIPLVYSGSIERVDFGERKEDKGFVDVRVGNGLCEYSFVKVPTRPMIQIDVYLEPGSDQTDQIVKTINQYTLDDALVKIVYHIPEQEKDSVDLSVVARACSAAHYIASIVPMHSVVKRIRRAILTTSMTFKSRLSTYLESKKIIENRKKRLIEKALILQHEVDQVENHE